MPRKVLMNVEELLLRCLQDHNGEKVAFYADKLDVARSSIYRAAESSREILVCGGNVFLVRNNRFLSLMASHGVTIEGDTLAKAIAFARDRSFDPHTVFGLKFESGVEGEGILRIVQALLVAMSFDLPFSIQMELE